MNQLAHTVLESQAWPRRRLVGDVAMLFLLSTLSAVAAIYVARQPGTIATIWLANAVAISFLISSEPRRAPVLLIAAAAANFVANLVCGDPWLLSLAFVLPNTLEIALGAWLVTRTGQAQRFAADHRSFAQVLVAGSLLAPLAGATLGSALLQASSFGDFRGVWLEWYTGSALGSVSVLPLAITLRALPRAEWQARMRSAPFLGSVLVLLGALALSLHYLSFPFMAICAVLVLLSTVVLRVHAFALTLLTVCALAVALAFGWFVPITTNTALGHAQVYLSMLLVVGAAQIVAVLVARQRALDDVLSAVGSRTDSVVAFLDMAGVYRWINRDHATYSGIPNPAVLGRTLAEVVPESARDALMPLFDQAFQGSIAQMQGAFDTPGLGHRTMDIVIQAARDEEGRQIGVLFSATDISELEASRRELQRAVDELRASNEDLEQFVRIASHDMREPLNTIAQFCDLIGKTKSQELSETSQRYFSLVRQGAIRMRTLLDDVLKFVRISADEERVTDVVDLDAVTAEVLQALQAQLEASGASVQVGHLGEVHGHRSLVSLALQNLVSNAIKFVPPERRPEVNITAAVGNRDVRLTVADNGIGVDEARIRELGMPFRRLHARRKFDGTGLGLAICKRIAEQHGGRLEIESTLGEGSRFHLVLATHA